MCLGYKKTLLIKCQPHIFQEFPNSRNLELLEQQCQDLKSFALWSFGATLDKFKKSKRKVFKNSLLCKSLS